MKKKILSYIPIIIGVIVLLFFCFLRFSGATNQGSEKVLVHSTLVNAISVSELSSSQFTYNGIANIYTDDSNSKIECRVRYSATVQAGVDMTAIDFEIDDKARTVKPKLPEIQITANIVNEKSFSFIPANSNVPLNRVMAACKLDAMQEAEQSGALFDSAEENLKSVIEALLFPILDPHDYSLIWE